MLWLILGAMTLAAMALVLLPLWRRQGGVVRRQAYDIAVYRDQLDEIGRERERGVVTEEEAEAARAEIERRLLIAAKSEEPADSAGSSLSSRRPIVLAACAIAISLPLAAGIGYLYLGSPGLSGQPFAGRTPPGGPSHAEIGVLAAKLAKKLKQSPGNLEGWLLLASTYSQMKRYDDAARAYARAIPLVSEQPQALSDITSAYGEALMLASGGVITPVARAAFAQALAKDKANARASYYLGLALLQEGKSKEALRMWTALAGRAPADAPWLAELRNRIARIAKEQGIDLGKLGPAADPAAAIGRGEAPPPGPDQADIEAASRMSGNERQAMIESMVARLATRLESEPEDFDGWRRLGRAYTVLGRHQAARDAYGRAAELRPKDVPVLLAYAGALLEAAGRPQSLPGEFIAIMRRVAAIDPENQEGMWYLGWAASETGDDEEAIRLWRRLLGQLPPGSPKKAMIEQAIEALEKKKKE